MHMPRIAPRAPRHDPIAAPLRPGPVVSRGWLVAAAAATIAWVPAPAQAQAAKPNAVAVSAGITGLGTFDTDLDNGGGSFSWTGMIASGSLKHRVNAQWAVGLNVGYQFEHWSFSTPSAFGNDAPWGTINRPSVGATISYQADESLGFFVSPQLEWDYETGNDSNAQNFGAVLGATKVFSRELVAGIGAGIFRQINDTKVFPFLILSWQIDDKWKLANPFQAGPAGGAGLELSYAIDDRWELAGGGTYREYRFRLKSSGPNAEGIGQNQGIPLFARLTRKLGPQGRLDLWAGATVAGTLKLRDPNGNELVSSDYNAAPFLALTLRGDF
jgi:hypothetical protein